MFKRSCQTRSRLVKLSIIAYAMILCSCTVTTDSKDRIPVPKPDLTLNGSTTDQPAACIAFVPLTWSEHDTRQTILEAKAHNAVWKRICRKDREIN